MTLHSPRILENLQIKNPILSSQTEAELALASLEKELVSNLQEEKDLETQRRDIHTRRGVLLSKIKLLKPKDWRRWYKKLSPDDSPLQYTKLAAANGAIEQKPSKQKKTVPKADLSFETKPIFPKEELTNECKQFNLSTIPSPDGCAEIISIIDTTFTTKFQWSYLRIYIEQHEPQ